MIDQDQQRDYAEEAALAAEQQRENASEAAFEATQLRAVRELEQLAAHSRLRALQFARQINEQLDRMALLDTSHLLMMKRSATVAHMAQRAALTLSTHRGYDLTGQLEALLRPILADDPNGTGAFAATRVRLALRQAIEGAQEDAFAAASGHED